MDKFFIFGHARSGTTLLTRLIRLHPQVHCNYQGHFFTRPPLLQSLVADKDIQSWLTRRSNRWNHGKNLSPVILRAAVDFILERDASKLGKSIVGDKSPNSLLNGEAVDLLHKIYPDARLIFIVRDGRDAVISHRFQSFIDAAQHLNKEDRRIRESFSENPEPFDDGTRSIFTEKGLEKAARGWVANVTETVERGKNLYRENFINLRFEDLLANPSQEIGLLWRFLGADSSLEEIDALIQTELSSNPDADWQRQKAGDIARSLQKGQRGSWQRHFTPRDQTIFYDIAGDSLRTWEYM